MLNIGKKDADGRQVRIEHRGRHLRASRTGGVSLRAQTRAAGVNLSANSRHGVRLSHSVGKGTNVFVQNGRIGVRGRYGKGPLKLNVSKSGATVSTKTGIGTLNLVRPGRSSVKVAGVQMRGKKAAQVQVIYLVLQLIGLLLQALAQLLVAIVSALFKAGRYTVESIDNSLQARKARSLDRWQMAHAPLLDDKAPAELLAGLGYLILFAARGQPDADERYMLASYMESQAAADEPAAFQPLLSAGMGDLASGRLVAVQLLPPATRNPLKAYPPAIELLAAAYAAATSPADALAAFAALDEAAVTSSRRNILQEQLLLAAATGFAIHAASA